MKMKKINLTLFIHNLVEKHYKVNKKIIFSTKTVEKQKKL